MLMAPSVGQKDISRHAHLQPCPPVARPGWDTPSPVHCPGQLGSEELSRLPGHSPICFWLHGCTWPGRRAGSLSASPRRRERGWRLANCWARVVKHRPRSPLPLQMQTAAAPANRAVESITSSHAWCRKVRDSLAKTGCLPPLPCLDWGGGSSLASR